MVHIRLMERMPKLKVPESLQRELANFMALAGKEDSVTQEKLVTLLLFPGVTPDKLLVELLALRDLLHTLRDIGVSHPAAVDLAMTKLVEIVHEPQGRLVRAEAPPEAPRPRVEAPAPARKPVEAATKPPPPKAPKEPPRAVRAQFDLFGGST